MFSVFGGLLAGFGLVSDPKIYAEHSLGINVNLDWGIVLILFGVTMLVLALRAQRPPAPGAEPPREHG